ncbi:MAG: MBL fold metallo-hydrolase [Cyclobacteriaceae bacterium]|nr:MBL fold metallo-hydrolase [Cyclobacteriaceae bacterium]
MLKIKRIPGQKYTSNIYIISSELCPDFVYLVDCGCTIEMERNNFDFNSVKGVFLTHAHYDHIEGLQLLLKKNKKVKVFCSDFTAEALVNPRLNLSFYHEMPLSLFPDNLQIVYDNQVIPIFEEYSLEAFATPGHDQGCFSFKILNYCFTGDSFIPNIPVVTKLKTGNKNESFKSLKKIRGKLEIDDFVCPGHLDIIHFDQIKWEMYV